MNKLLIISLLTFLKWNHAQAIQPTVMDTCKIPNIFTPNGDGINDTFIIPCIHFSNNESEIRIFNEWGDELYQATPYGNNWDGTFHHKPLPDGTYYYCFRNGKNLEFQKGFITLYR
jgi:gliding motility-associated-like protein